MQERGTGVSDEFLLNPAARIAVAGGGRGGPVGSRRGRGQYATAAAGAGGAVMGGARASRHKALVLGGRPGRRQQTAAAHRGGAAQAGAAAARGGRSNAGKAAKAAARAVGGNTQATGAGAEKKGKKGTKAKPAPANAGDLDSQLDAYMMKDSKTATSVLDNDLDSYMADKPAENAW
ncbi:hypothetical protein BGZ88_011115 [Linnemannia elongata]|nr:hypothetical protein BGZ88_011115 [Linnemannia elongata]